MPIFARRVGRAFADCCGMPAPARLAAPVAVRMAGAIGQLLRDPAIREPLQRTGSDLAMLGPEVFATFLCAGDAKWAGAARERLLRPAS